MIVEIPLAPSIERCDIDTPRGRIAALHAKPERPAGQTAILVAGFMGTKEDFREVLPPLARAGYDAWAYDHPGQHGASSPPTPATDPAGTRSPAWPASCSSSPRP